MQYFEWSKILVDFLTAEVCFVGVISKWFQRTTSDTKKKAGTVQDYSFFKKKAEKRDV